MPCCGMCRHGGKDASFLSPSLPTFENQLALVHFTSAHEMTDGKTALKLAFDKVELHQSKLIKIHENFAVHWT